MGCGWYEMKELHFHVDVAISNSICSGFDSLATNLNYVIPKACESTYLFWVNCEVDCSNNLWL